jgi:hypothetical protein
MRSVQAVELQELAEGVGRGGKAGGHLHALRQLRDHLAEAGVFAADDSTSAMRSCSKGTTRAVGLNSWTWKLLS